MKYIASLLLMANREECQQNGAKKWTTEGKWEVTVCRSHILIEFKIYICCVP